MIKHSKIFIVSILLAVVAIGLIFFDQLTSSPPLVPHPLVLEEAAYVQSATVAQGEPVSLESLTARFPLQALKVEEIETNVTPPFRPASDLFSIVLQLFAFENESNQPKALFFYAWPLCFSAPIYILFRQILV